MPQTDPFLAALEQVRASAPPPAAPPDDDPFLAALSEVRAESGGDSRSLFSRGYDALFTAPAAVTSAARRMADAIDAPSADRSRAASMARGFVGGAIQGAANLLTPGDAALLVAGPAGRLVKGGAQVARGLNAAADVATMARGAERLATAESPSEAAAGVAQVALGGASRAASRRPLPAPAARPVRGELTSGASYVGTPKGEIVPAGVAVPGDDAFVLALEAVRRGDAPDPSFARGVPAEYARREVRGLLPAKREPLITPPPADASGVRSVPAAVVDRERMSGRVRQYAGDAEVAESVPAPASVPARRPLSEAGQAHLKTLREDARREGFVGSDDELDALFFDKLGQAEAVARDLEGVGAEGDVLTAIAERGGISLSAESGGANARQMGMTGNRGELRALMESLDYGTSVGGFNKRTGATKATKLYPAGGVRGIGTIINQQKDGRSLDAMAEALREAGFEIEGPNQLLDAIDSALVKYRKGSDDAPGVASTLENLFDVRPGGRWWRDPDADDFDAFSKAFDDVVRGSGETGAARGDVLATIASTAGGSAAGAATIEEDDPYWKRAAKVIGGAAFGAAVPALLRGGPRASVLPMTPAGIVKGERGQPLKSYVYDANAPIAGRKGAAMNDPMAGVDTFLGKFSNPLVRDGIKERLLANGGFAEQRRGTVNTDALDKFATNLRIDVSKSLPKGAAASAEIVTAYARGLRQNQERIANLAAKVNDGSATDADVLGLEMARADGDVILGSLMGLRSEAGRALGAFRAIGGLFDSGNVELIRGAAAQLRDEAARFAGEFAKQPADAMARYAWLKKQGGVSTWDKMRSYWYANILSGVKTHERNVLGNVFNALGNLAAHPVSAGLDAARSAATGQPRRMLFGELPHGVAGMFAGMDRGLSDAVFTLRHGITPSALQKGLHSAELGKLDLPRYEFGGGGANPFNWPGRALDSADSFFRSVGRNAELYESAYTAARSEGLKGDALKRRMSHLITGTSPEAVALREQAEHVAARAVFQEKGGPITSFLAQGYKVPVIGQAMTFTIPFLRTPGNILRQGLEASPVGFLMKEAGKEGRAGAIGQGKAAAGSLAAGYLAWLASTERISGDGPKDRKERARLMDKGWRPNSVRIGDKWVSYQLFQPVSVQAAIIANAFEAWREGGAKDRDLPELVAQTMTRAANSFLEQSFFSGLSDLQNAISDPERFGSRWAGRTMQGLTPFSGMQRSIQSGLDPVVRQPDTAMEQVKAAMPGLSETVPARLDRFGEDVRREGGPLRRVADPLNTSTIVDDVVSDELVRLEVSLPDLTARMKLPRDYVLTDEETRRVRQTQGREMRAALDAVVGRSNYARLPDKLKASLLTKAIERARTDVAKRVRNDVLRGRDVLSEAHGGRATAPVPASGAARSSRRPPSAGQVMTRDQLRALAMALNISEQQAERIYTARGYSIQQ